MKKQRAFSLAEITVALLIIGVIAAISILALFQNMQKREYVIGCKKADSSLSQAVSKVEMESGPPGKTPYWNDPEKFWPLFTGHFNVIKICGYNETGCATKGQPKYLNNTNSVVADYDGYEYGMRTADGMWYNYRGGASPCALNGLSASTQASCIGRFIVDVNGDKAPNKFGEDMFVFALVKNLGLVPAGIDGVTDCTRTGLGMSCAAKVIREGKISY